MESHSIEPLATLQESSTVHSVCFSPDGGYLIWGGGSSDGRGYLHWCSASSAQPGELDLGDPSAPDWKISVELAQRLGLRGVSGRDLMGSAAISGLAFDQSGHHLAMTLWARGHRYFPSLVTQIEGSTLHLLAIFAASGNELDPYELKKRFANGVILLDDTLVVHRWAAPAHVLEYHPISFRAGSVPHHRHSSRIAPLGRGWFATGTDAGLVLSKQGGPVRVISGTDVSAICCEPLGGGFATGNSRGELSNWRFHIDQEQLQPGPSFLCPSGHQIEALGYLKGGLLVAGCRAGTVTLWRNGEMVGGLKLPNFSVRTLACHPHLPCVALGGKGSQGEGVLFFLWVF